MLLNQIAGKSNPLAKRRENRGNSMNFGDFRLFGGTSERRSEREKLAMGVGVFRDLAMRAAGTAGLGASPQSLVDDGLEGARASAAFGTTTETAVNLLGATREIICSADGVADIVVAEDVAGTNNH
jgi:hypothetical protein